MRRLLVISLPMLLALALASDAQGAVDATAAASVMGVSTAQASEDLAVQHDAFHIIGKLIEAGDHVWFDNQTATVHVYGPSTPVAIDASVASHVVHDTTLHSFPGVSGASTPASCGTSRAYEEYCSPMEGGVRISHQSGAIAGDCTAGFLVRDSSGATGMITAAHCAIYGTTFYSNPFTSKTWPGLSGCEPGPWVEGAAPWSGYDAALTPVVGCGGMIPYMHNWETGADTHQEGATNTQFVGEYVCHWGVTSLHQCGTIRAVNVSTTINYADTGSGEWSIKETDQVCGYAAPGDSGGPVTDGTYQGDATGILLAVKSEPACGGTKTLWTEQRIFAVLGLFGVSVAS